MDSGVKAPRRKHHVTPGAPPRYTQKELPRCGEQDSTAVNVHQRGALIFRHGLIHAEGWADAYRETEIPAAKEECDESAPLAA